MPWKGETGGCAEIGHDLRGFKSPRFRPAASPTATGRPIVPLGFDRDRLQARVDRCHAVCPDSRATRGNIDVPLSVWV
jgi:hypothetical protein